MFARKNSLVYGAIILSVAGFINRILGFIYRVMTVRIIGSEGIGLFQMVLPPFSLLLILTTAGIPLTLSKLISQQVALNRYSEAKKIFLVALKILLVTSISISIISWFGAPYFIRLFFSDTRIYMAYLTLIPAIVIVAFSSAFRGYFLGLKMMFPSALSTIMEQIVRIIVGLSTLYLLIPYGIEYAIIGLALGIVAGELTGLIVLIVYYKRQIDLKKYHIGSGDYSGFFQIVKNIYSLSIPLTLNRIVSSLLLTAQAVIIPSRLQVAGFSIRESTDLFGQFTGIAMILVGLPTIVTVSLATTMVPAISEAQAANNILLIRKRIIMAIKITVLAGIPWVIIFYTIPGKLCTTIFNTPDAAIPLKYLAFGALFIYLQQTSTGIIQGMGKMYIMLKHTIIGAIINLTGIYMLTAISGIKGTAIAFNLSAMTVAILNLTFLINHINLNFSFKKILYIILSSIVMMLGMIISSKYITILGSNLGLTFLNLLIGLIIYTACIFLLGLININEMKILKKI